LLGADVTAFFAVLATGGGGEGVEAVEAVAGSFEQVIQWTT